MACRAGIKLMFILTFFSAKKVIKKLVAVVCSQTKTACSLNLAI